jgi:hypothetical protein
MRFLGNLAHGIQDDPYANIAPEVLQNSLGIDEEQVSHVAGTTGAGASIEDAYLNASTTGIPGDADDLAESGLSTEELDALELVRHQLSSEESRHVRHPPVKVPTKCPPFQDVETEDLFWEAVSLAMTDEQSFPVGYGVLPDEWEQDTYPEFHYIGTTRKQSDVFNIALPSQLWYPRAVEWVTALHIMESFLTTH